MSKAPNSPPDPGDRRQDAKRGDQTAIGQPEHQQEPHDSGNRDVFVLDRQPHFLPARFVAYRILAIIRISGLSNFGRHKEPRHHRGENIADRRSRCT
jgi:hypothetical protein